MTIEGGHAPHPYHNATHAAGVVHMMHMLLVHGSLLGGYADPLAHMACIIAAVRQPRISLPAAGAAAMCLSWRGLDGGRTGASAGMGLLLFG